MTQTIDQLRPRDDDDLPGPDIDDDTLDCLTDTQANSFSATPTTVDPFGPPVTLRWSVSRPSTCGVVVKLNGQSVGLSGSMQVQPAVTTRYTLTAGIGGLSKTLRSLTVAVDTSACVTVPVPESTVRTAIRGVVDQIDAATNQLSQRSAAKVEIVPGGVSVALRLKAAVDNFADPDIDVDFTIGLRIRNGAVEPFYKSFSVDVDWPWWVTVVTLGVSKFVEELIDDKIESAARPLILQAVKDLVDGLVERLPGNLRLHSLQLLTDELRVTACPAGPSLRDDRFLVLTTGELQGIDADG
jgi:hypothetical protein